MVELSKALKPLKAYKLETRTLTLETLSPQPETLNP